MSAVKVVFSRYMSALRQHDRAECQKIIEDLIEQNVPAKDLYLELIRAGMYEIGYLWEKNEISVTEEHLASAITEGLINAILPRYQAEFRNGKSVLLACAKQEHHQIGIKIVADIFQLGGWETHFVGVDLTAENLSSYIEEFNPDLLALSISIFFNLSGLKEVVLGIRETYADLKIVIGGQAINQGVSDSLDGVRFCEIISTFEELESVVAGVEK